MHKAYSGVRLSVLNGMHAPTRPQIGAGPSDYDKDKVPVQCSCPEGLASQIPDLGSDAWLF